MADRLVPVSRRNWCFFDRQRALFSEFFKDFDEEYSNFEDDLEQMRKSMFKLARHDDNNDSGSEGEIVFKNERQQKDSDLGEIAVGDAVQLQVERPFVTDIDGNKKLALRFDVSQFNPEEITVKTNGYTLNVYAKHVEESPGKKIYREFSKSYTLPTHVDPNQLASTLSDDGVLHIEAPATAAIEAPKELLIPVTKM